MFMKRTILIVLLSLIIHLGWSASQNVQADVLRKHIDKSTPLLVQAGSCQDMVTAAGTYLMTLPVTEALAAELNGLMASGETPVVAIRSRVGIQASGNGSAGYQGQIAVYIEGADGNRRDLDQFTESHQSYMDYILENVMISSFAAEVMPGDNVQIEITGQGFADAGGCDSSDQASLAWEITAILCSEGEQYGSCSE